MQRLLDTCRSTIAARKRGNFLQLRIPQHRTKCKEKLRWSACCIPAAWTWKTVAAWSKSRKTLPWLQSYDSLQWIYKQFLFTADQAVSFFPCRWAAMFPFFFYQTGVLRIFLRCSHTLYLHTTQNCIHYAKASGDDFLMPFCLQGQLGQGE